MKAKTHFLIDSGMLAAFLICAVSGILKIPELNVPMSDDMYLWVTLLHDWSGVVSVILITLHFVLHAKWMRKVGKSFFRKPEKRTGLAVVQSKAGILLAMVILLQWGSPLYARGGRHSYNATVPARIDYSDETLEDGVYTGTAEGYEPGLTVEVTVEDHSITDIQFVSHSETMRWWRRVVDLIPQRILKAQSTDADAVSGATASSYGIMSAVEDALSGARD